MHVFKLLLLLLALAFVVPPAQAQCNYTVCRNYCNSSRACFGHTCPDQFSLGQHITVFFNWSSARIDWTMGVGPGESAVSTVLDLENYRRLLNNQSYSFDYQSIPKSYTCQTSKGGASQGRGWALVYTCTTPTCSIWHDEIGQNDQEFCAVNCTSGTVGDGICNPACNVSECVFDLGDCNPKPTPSIESTSTNPDQDSSSAPRQCFPGCDSSMIGNGICNWQCAFPSCSDDGGDCLTTNPCAGNPCINGGSCSLGSGNSLYQCSCPEPYCGPQCQHTQYTDSSSSLPTTIYCLSEYSDCQSRFDSFTFCCYGSVSNCTNSAPHQGTLAGPPASPPAPNAARKIGIF